MHQSKLESNILHITPIHATTKKKKKYKEQLTPETLMRLAGILFFLYRVCSSLLVARENSRLIDQKCSFKQGLWLHWGGEKKHWIFELAGLNLVI